MPDDHGSELKGFFAGRVLVEAELESLASSLGIPPLLMDASVEGPNEEVEDFVSQFDSDVLLEADAMARHYRLFYAFEHYVRRLVAEQLVEAFGDSWWGEVPEQVRNNADNNRKREVDGAITARSDSLLDYTTFGELSVIIESSFDDCFGDLLNSRKGAVSVLSRLNLLRGPIAHFSPLAEDEVLRLHLSIRDWFRVMG